MKIVVVGQGYVGLPVAIRAVDVGFDVVGLDLAEWKIEGLKAGRSHIDDITDDDVASALATGRYHPTAFPHDVAEFDIAVITVPTPLRDGAPDMTYVESACRLLAGHLRTGATVVLESTTYPGTTEELAAPLLEAGSGLRAGADFHLGFSPERIDPGNERWTFRRTPKIVSGVDDASLKVIQVFYDQLVDETIVVSGTREAEFAKLLENTYRHVNIAMVNELAIHANALGIDIWEVIRAASSKPFGYTPFFPGPGVGGHCLPIDPSYLSWKIEQNSGNVARFVKVANDVNNRMPSYVVERVMHGLNNRGKATKGAEVLVLGVAYKKNSNDARETPATGVIEGLLRLGAQVSAYDPHVDRYDLFDRCHRLEQFPDDVERFDVVVLVTDHDTIDYDRLQRGASYIFDTRHRLRGENVEHL